MGTNTHVNGLIMFFTTLEVVLLELEVALWVVTCWADLRSILADLDVTTVTTLPD